MDKYRNMQRRPREAPSSSSHSKRRYNETPTYSQLKLLPVNLRKKALREARNHNQPIHGKRYYARRQRLKQAKAPQLRENFERCEHKAMLAATAQELQEILTNCELLSDIPYDSTPAELLGEIAIAEGQATTIYVERIGLSKLTIVLHQKQPTIANLKQAIATVSLAQHKRTQRERHEERLKRRGVTISSNTSTTTTTTAAAAVAAARDDQQQRLRQQQQVDSMPCFTGELVCSALRNGHNHRAHVSWRFLWRVYMLFNVDTNQPINDEDGRATLTSLGIENAATLRFTHRIKYSARKRQS